MDGSRFEFSCASVEVPLDYERPGGPKISIALSRLHPKNAHDVLGPLLVNPGGPGSSGMGLASSLAGELPARVADRFDIVGFDPRGTGQSGRVSCFDPRQLSQLRELPDLREPGALARARALQGSINQGCAAKLGPQLAHYSTYEAAQDMESIRLSLGAPQISYLGFSYGTFLGAVYAHLHPGAVRAMVLDSPVDFSRPPAEFFEGVLDASEETFDVFAQWASRGPHAGQLVGVRQRLAEIVGKNYRAAGIRDVFDKLRHYDRWPQLADSLAQLQDRPLSESAPPVPDTAGSLRAIWCDDQRPELRVGDADAARFAAEWPKRGALFGASLANQSLPGLLDCTDWPEPAHPATEGVLDATGSAPLLVVSGTHDPNTPHSWAEAFTAATRTGVLLGAGRPGHAQYMGQQVASGCLNTAVDDYLVDLKLPAPGTVCPVDR